MPDDSRSMYLAETVWEVDSRGYLLTPSGAKAARIVGQTIMLLDKRTHEEIPLTLADFFIVTQTQA